MQLIEPQQRDGSGSEERMPFRALLVFDGRAMGLAGMRLFNSITAELQESIDFRFSLWTLSVLRVEELRRAAVDDAAQADLILLALRHDGGLAHLSRTWVGDWLQRRDGRPGALVLYADGPAAAGAHFAGLRDDLNAVARRAGMDFFSAAASPAEVPTVTTTGYSPWQDWTSRTPRRRQADGDGEGSGLEAGPPPSHAGLTRFWGLNEW